MANTPPSKAPTTPVVFGTPTLTSITVRFVITNITGKPSPIYSILYGTTTNPTTVGTATPVSKSKTTYQAVINNLKPNTKYYIKSVAKNSVGSKTSTSAIIRTAGDPPSKAPTVPAVFGTPTATSITVRFVITNITGTPTPTYSILYGTTTNPTTVGTATLVSKSKTTYQAVINNLKPNTTYYIKSVAKNSVGSKSSATYAEYTGEKLTYRPLSGGLEYEVSGFVPNVPLQNLVIPSSYNGKPVIGIGNEAFNNYANLTGTLTIPDSIVSIGPQAFFRCGNLTGTLTIPNSVTSIGFEVFVGCYNLTGLKLGTGIRGINNGLFSECTGLKGTLTIPNSVTRIERQAFQNCRSLTGRLTIPNSVTSIDALAFNGCTGLTGTVTVRNGVPSIGTDAFLNTQVVVVQA